MSRTTLGVALGAGALIGALVASPAIAGADDDARPAAPVKAGQPGGSTDYVVLLEPGADRAAARDAVRAAGGKIVDENRALGTLTAEAPADGFALEVSRSAEVVGAAGNQAIGRAPQVERARDTVEREHLAAARAGKDVRAGTPVRSKAASRSLDPLDENLWGLQMVRSDLARKVNAGDRRVKVGIIDTGIDARNPDIAPNFDAKLSRNFAPDMPEVDGPCEFRSCVDPVGWDDNGHGTHVAGTVGAAANGFGISGVAPKVSLVEVRAGQDFGYFFLDQTAEALTYAGDAGLDVVNMSFYVDPWLYNCRANPADSPEDQAEQRVIIKTMKRALNYAHSKGVTMVGALGNNHEDLGKPRTDESSPDFPPDPGVTYPRPIDNESCFDLPVEGPHVIGVSSLGPSAKKSDYSNYGLEQISVAAPGGYFRDYVGTDRFNTVQNLILSSYPVNTLQDEGLVDAEGELTPDGVAAGIIKRCPTGVSDHTRCGYYNWLQGTSMASPHAAGVSALIASEYGRAGAGGFGADPDKVERILYRSAQERACPNPPLVSYEAEGRDAEYDALCEGDREFNGFYGNGIVDAYAAVTGRR